MSNENLSPRSGTQNQDQRPAWLTDFTPSTDETRRIGEFRQQVINLYEELCANGGDPKKGKA